RRLPRERHAERRDVRARRARRRPVAARSRTFARAERRTQNALSSELRATHAGAGGTTRRRRSAHRRGGSLGPNDGKRPRGRAAPTSPRHLVAAPRDERGPHAAGEALLRARGARGVLRARSAPRPRRAFRAGRLSRIPRARLLSRAALDLAGKALRELPQLPRTLERGVGVLGQHVPRRDHVRDGATHLFEIVVAIGVALL